MHNWIVTDGNISRVVIIYFGLSKSRFWKPRSYNLYIQDETWRRKEVLDPQWVGASTIRLLVPSCNCNENLCLRAETAMESLNSLLQQQLNLAQVAREYCGRKRIDECMVKWKRRGKERGRRNGSAEWNYTSLDDRSAYCTIRGNQNGKENQPFSPLCPLCLRNWNSIELASILSPMEF